LKRNRKTVLLTGARGRLGSEIRRSLPDDLIEVIPFSRTRSEGVFSLVDLMTPGLWGEADAVIHGAWSTVPILSERNIGVEWQQDFPLLLELMKSVAIRTPRPHFIFLSSGGSVYGNANVRPSREADTLRPIGWHGFAKSQAESLVHEYCSKAEIPYTILRISNPYGFPASSERPQGIIPIMIQAALDDQCFRIWGDGLAQKDFIHAQDVVDAMRKIVSGRVVGLFNLSYGVSYSIKSVIEILENSVGRSLTLDYSAGYPWDVTDSRLDNTKLMEAIDWKPIIPIERGLRIFVDSMRRGPLRP
jgi:UDP-glucose 4-epimerase